MHNRLNGVGARGTEAMITLHLLDKVSRWYDREGLSLAEIERRTGSPGKSIRKGQVTCPPDDRWN